LWAVEDIVDGRAEYGNQKNSRSVSATAKQLPANMPRIPQPASSTSARSSAERNNYHNGLPTSSNFALNTFTVVRAHTPTGLAVVHDPEGHLHDLEAFDRERQQQQHQNSSDEPGPLGSPSFQPGGSRDAVRQQWMRVFGSTYNERVVQAKHRSLPSHLVEIGSSVDDAYHQDPASSVAGFRRPSPKVHLMNNNQHRSGSRSRSNNNLSDADIILAHAKGAADAGIMTQPLPSTVSMMRKSAQQQQQYESSISRSQLADQSPIPLFRESLLQEEQKSKQLVTNNNNTVTPARASPIPQPQLFNAAPITPVVVANNKPSILAPKQLSDRHLLGLGQETPLPSPTVNTAAPSPVSQQAPAPVPVVAAAKKLPAVPVKSTTPTTNVNATPSSSNSTSAGMGGVMAELLAKRKPVEPTTTTMQQQAETPAKTAVEVTPPATAVPKKMPKLPAVPVPGTGGPKPAAKPAAASSSGGSGGMGGVFAELLAKRKPVE
jgi:hypothetical protein